MAKAAMSEPATIMPNIGDVMSVSYQDSEVYGDVTEWHMTPPAFEATITMRLRQPDAIQLIESAVMKNLRPLLSSLRCCPIAFETAEDLPIIADWLDDAGDERGPLIRAIGKLCQKEPGRALEEV